MEKIKDIKIRRDYKIPTATDPSMWGTITITAKFIIPVPTSLATQANNDILDSYKTLFSIAELVAGNLIFDAQVVTNIFTDGQPDSLLPNNGLISAQKIRELLEDEYAVYEYKLSQFQLMPFDIIFGDAWDGTTWSDQIIPTP